MQICKLVNDIIASNDKYGAAQSEAGRPFQAWVSSHCGFQTACHPTGAEVCAFAGMGAWLRWGFMPSPSPECCCITGIIVRSHVECFRDAFPVWFLTLK